MMPSQRLSSASYIATSRNCPTPVLRAAWIAATMPSAASVPGKRSPMLAPHGTPLVPADPVVPTMPPMHCATMSKAGQSAYGLAPVRGSPKPRTAA